MREQRKPGREAELGGHVVGDVGGDADPRNAGLGGGIISLTPGAAPLSKLPFEAYGQLNFAGFAQIIGTIGLIELYSESVKPHYTRGGQPGYLPIVAPSGLAEEIDLRAANKELKNGRAAMVGMMGFFAAHFVPGSVPFLDGVPL